MKHGEMITLTAGIPKSGETPNSQHPLSRLSECIVLVKFTEQRRKHPNGEMYECSIEIRVNAMGQHNAETWGATYNPGGSDEKGRIRLSNGFITLPECLQGRRVGTWIMNEIIKWASQWPNAEVQPIRLRKDQAYPENKARRNKFYEKFGFAVGLDTDEGSSQRNLFVSDLRTVDCPENIKIMTLNEKIASLALERDRLLLRVKAAETSGKRDLDRFNKEQKHYRKFWYISCAITLALGLVIGAQLF